jgi:hypothetical protein
MYRYETKISLSFHGELCCSFVIFSESCEDIRGSQNPKEINLSGSYHEHFR